MMGRTHHMRNDLTRLDIIESVFNIVSPCWERSIDIKVRINHEQSPDLPFLGIAAMVRIDAEVTYFYYHSRYSL